MLKKEEASTKKKEDTIENQIDFLIYYPEKIEQSHSATAADTNVEDLLVKLKSILGYKIRMLDHNIFLFKSVYAYTDDDVFCIRITKNNMLQVIKTSYLQEWIKEYDKYVVRGKSICAFLSAVNLELFHRNTVDGYVKK